jgi:hypothetical protein
MWLNLPVPDLASTFLHFTQQIFTLKIKEKLENISPAKKFCKQTETTIYQKLFCRALHWWSKTKIFLANNQPLFNKQG